MKLKALLFAICSSLCFLSYAENQHLHPMAESIKDRPIKPELKWPGYCEIELINQSYVDVYVTGTFDDGYSLRPFYIYSNEAPHYISLYYYGYCHAGMDLDVDTYSGYHLYGGYTRRESTIRILPFMTNQAKVEIKAK